jgi:hypothetical protein
MEEIVKIGAVPGKQNVAKSHLNGITTPAQDHITAFIIME